MAQAEEYNLRAQQASCPGTILFASGRRIKVGVRPRRGLRFEALGGATQQREITIVAAVADLPRSELLSAEGSITRTITFTHVETSIRYRIQPGPGSVEASPHGVFWIIKGTQEVVA